MNNQSKPPRVRLDTYTWRDPDGTQTPGIAIRHYSRIAAHLTPAEAIQMADRLVDLAERVESRTPVLPLVDASGTPEDPLPTTDLERE